MELHVDLHCHIYPCYQLENLLRSLAQPRRIPLCVVLTERADCNYFDQLETTSRNLPGIRAESIDSTCIRLGGSVYVLRGRQYATKEGIEVLSLGSSPQLPEKQQASYYCEGIRDQGGVIGFSWAFGKWRGFRAGLICDLARNFGKERVVLLDSALRPAVFGLPQQFFQLQSEGFRILSGSDPLPLKNHQANLGCRYSILEVKEPHGQGMDSTFFRAQFIDAPKIGDAGERSSLIQFLVDQASLRFR